MTDTERPAEPTTADHTDLLGVGLTDALAAGASPVPVAHAEADCPAGQTGGRYCLHVPATTDTG